jgi:hypothetical protein
MEARLVRESDLRLQMLALCGDCVRERLHESEVRSKRGGPMIESPWLPQDVKLARKFFVISGSFIVGVVVLCGTFIWRFATS